MNVCWWHVPKIVRIGGCVLKLQPVKLGTFFETQCTALTERQMHGQTDRQTDIFRQRSPHYNARRCVKSGTHWRQSRLLPKPATNRQQCRLLPIRSTLSPVCTGLKGAFTRTLHEWFHWNASSCWLSHRTDRSATAVYGNGRIRIFFNGQATANRFDRYCPLQTTLH